MATEEEKPKAVGAERGECVVQEQSLILQGQEQGLSRIWWSRREIQNGEEVGRGCIDEEATLV